MWTLLGFFVVAWCMTSLQRQIEEIAAHVAMLHNDVRDEIYERYGERFDGKK